MIKLDELSLMHYGIQNEWGYYIERNKFILFIPCSKIYKCFYSNKDIDISLNSGRLENLYYSYKLNTNEINIDLNNTIKKDTAIILSLLLCDKIAREKFFYYFFQKSINKASLYKIFFPCNGEVNLYTNITFLNGYKKKIYYVNNLDYLELPPPRNICTYNLSKYNVFLRKINYKKDINDSSEYNFTQLMIFLNALSNISFINYVDDMTYFKVKRGTLIYTLICKNKYFKIFFLPNMRYNFLILSFKREPSNNFISKGIFNKIKNIKKDLPNYFNSTKVYTSILPKNFMSKKQKKKWLKIILHRLEIY